MIKGEKIFENEKKVKYVLQKPYRESDNLIIIFSSFQKKNKRPRYNYMRTIDEFHCNKLFILDDFGARASYYLCENRNFSIERSIVALINKVIKENSIKTVVTAGSSKGGYAALYCGIKYGFDYIIAASPQYYIGDYVLEQANANEVAEFMAGSDSNEGKQYLNNIMPEVIKNVTVKPDVFIHLGEREMHYNNHVIPMLKDLGKVGIDYKLDLGDYEKHSEVATFFPPIFKNKVRKYLGFPMLEISVKKINNSNVYQFRAITEDPNTAAWYFYHDNKRIEMIGYAENKTFEFKPSKKGNYKMKIFVKNKQGLIVSATSPVIHI